MTLMTSKSHFPSKGLRSLVILRPQLRRLSLKMLMRGSRTVIAAIRNKKKIERLRVMRRSLKAMKMTMKAKTKMRSS